MNTCERLTTKTIFGLLSPQAWTSSILPVLTGTILSVHDGAFFSPILFYMLLATAILMQSAANSINNYCDFRNKTDLPENCDDPEQSILVFHKFRQGDIIAVIAVILVLAAAMGLWLVLMRGITLLLIGFVGGIVLFFYSAGPFPIYRTPLGELVSGFVMGGLIPMAVYIGMSGVTDFCVMLLSVPSILTVALMMMTNNLCDMEKDQAAGRRTLPIVIGERSAKIAYRWLVSLSCAAVFVIVVLRFPAGAFLLVLFAIQIAPPFLRLWRIPDLRQSRRECMDNMVGFNLSLNLCYIAIIGIDALL